MECTGQSCREDGKQHTYAIWFISSPDAFASLFPTAQNVIGGLTWFS